MKPSERKIGPKPGLQPPTSGSPVRTSPHVPVPALPVGPAGHTKPRSAVQLKQANPAHVVQVVVPSVFRPSDSSRPLSTRVAPDTPNLFLAPQTLQRNSIQTKLPFPLEKHRPIGQIAGRLSTAPTRHQSTACPVAVNTHNLIQPFGMNVRGAATGALIGVGLTALTTTASFPALALGMVAGTVLGGAWRTRRPAGQTTSSPSVHGNTSSTVQVEMLEIEKKKVRSMIEDLSTRVEKTALQARALHHLEQLERLEKWRDAMSYLERNQEQLRVKNPEPAKPASTLTSRPRLPSFDAEPRTKSGALLPLTAGTSSHHLAAASSSPKGVLIKATQKTFYPTASASPELTLTNNKANHAQQGTTKTKPFVKIFGTYSGASATLHVHISDEGLHYSKHTGATLYGSNKTILARWQQTGQKAENITGDLEDLLNLGAPGWKNKSNYK